MLSKLKKKKKYVKLSNFIKIYSPTNEKKYDINNLTQKYLLYQKFVSWSCNGTSGITKNASDERVYLDLRASSEYTNEAENLDTNYSKISLSILLKFAATKKDKIKGLGLF